MTCYYPIKAYRSLERNSSGKYPVVFNAAAGHPDLEVKIPCGSCIGCRLEKSRQWAIRCVHEAQMHDENCFITLTYNDEHVPENGTLVLRDYQLFMKRLRKKYSEKTIKFFHCGEYGENCAKCKKHFTKCTCYKYEKGLGRPHYHALIFGFDFPDKIIHHKVNNNTLYTSAILEGLWRKGFALIGHVTFESAAYVARYVIKKMNGFGSEEYYGEKKPEYITMSRNPGIGSKWFEKYKSDVFPSDQIIINGKAVKPPKYYDLKLEKDYPEEFKKLRAERTERGEDQAPNNTTDRLAVRKKIKMQKINMLPRN